MLRGLSSWWLNHFANSNSEEETTIDKEYFRIARIHKKIDSNHNMQMTMKWIAALTVFVIFFCSLTSSDTMNVAWMISIPVIVLLFFLDVYYIKRNKELE